MASTDCYYDAAGCLVCPEIPPSVGHAARVVSEPNLGWNSGANSVVMRDGDVRLAFTIDAIPAGTYVGLKGSRSGVTAPELITHAFYIYGIAGAAFVEVRERGARQGAASAYTLGDLLEIRREGGRVSYWLAGVKLRDSQLPSYGPVLVNACLYSAGDTIP